MTPRRGKTTAAVHGEHINYTRDMNPNVATIPIHESVVSIITTAQERFIYRGGANFPFLPMFFLNQSMHSFSGIIHTDQTNTNGNQQDTGPSSCRQRFS